MTLIQAKNMSSDDGDLIQKVVRRGLSLLSLAIIFLSSAALWAVIQLTDFYQNKVQVLAEQEYLLNVMRVAAHKRTLLMYTMVVEEDAFRNDDNRMAFYSAGAKFAQARIAFIKSPLADTELDLAENRGTLTSANRPLQEKVVDLVIRGQSKLALELLREQAIPEQNKVMQVLDQLNVSIDRRNNEVKKKANSISRASIIILVSIVIVIILGVIVIIRQTTFRSFNLISQLNETRKMLQNTIHELIQQKDTLDHHAIVSIADRQGKISYVNDKFCEISGYTREELIGKNHRILKSNMHSSEFYQNLWDTILQGNVWQGEICNKRKDGSHYWVESTISPFLDSKGIPYQYVSIRTDITHLLEAKLAAEEASRSKSLFLSSMSHELRTPMNAILGFSQIIDMTTKDGATKENIKEIISAANHLLELINEILGFSKIESGEIDLKYDSYSIKHIIEFCISMIKPSADKMSIRINNKLDSLPDIKINIDEKWFKQVVLNILSNAVKYNKESGSVTIEYSVCDNKMLYLSITDTGKGIPLNQQNNIFYPFNRAGEEGSSIAGSGLGLVISKNLIEKMNGAIGLESSDEEGSCFWIKVPLS